MDCNCDQILEHLYAGYGVDKYSHAMVLRALYTTIPETSAGPTLYIFIYNLGDLHIALFTKKRAPAKTNPAIPRLPQES